MWYGRLNYIYFFKWIFFFLFLSFLGCHCSLWYSLPSNLFLSALILLSPFDCFTRLSASAFLSHDSFLLTPFPSGSFLVEASDLLDLLDLMVPVLLPEVVLLVEVVLRVEAELLLERPLLLDIPLLTEALLLRDAALFMEELLMREALLLPETALL